MQCRLAHVWTSACVCELTCNASKSCCFLVRSRFSILGKWKLLTEQMESDLRVAIFVNSMAMQFRLNSCIMLHGSVFFFYSSFFAPTEHSNIDIFHRGNFIFCLSFYFCLSRILNKLSGFFERKKKHGFFGQCLDIKPIMSPLNWCVSIDFRGR